MYVYIKLPRQLLSHAAVVILDVTMSSTEPTERSLNRQVVLEEEEYTEALSRIIARDFFPSLVHLDATNEYLDALQSRDPHLINASVRRLQEVGSTPSAPSGGWGQTPYGMAGETPLRSADGKPAQKRARYDTSINLDEFQARYTSEDNSSFTQILDEENRVRKEKWAWAWDAQRRIEYQQAKMLEQRETMLLEPPKAPGVREKFMIEMPKPAGLITDSLEGNEGEAEGNERGLLVAIRESTTNDEPVDVMAPIKDTRPAGVDGWNFKVRLPLVAVSHVIILILYCRLEIPSCFLRMQTFLLITPSQCYPKPKQIRRLSIMQVRV